MKLLLISGHGAGDAGATAAFGRKNYREADETRRVTAALKRALGGWGDVALYPTDRNAFADYQKGTLRSVARFDQYDFVLEIHFNALKPSAADGKTKGVECYMPTEAKSVEIAERLCRGIAACGLTNRGVKRKNWSVIHTACKAGTPAALLEVCFIDDADDMAVYERQFPQIIQAIARALGADEEVDDVTVYATLSDVPAWGRPTVEKLMSKGWLRGEGDNTLALEHNMLRMLVINDRAGLYGE